MKRNTRVSTAVIRRLPRYYRQLSELQRKGVIRISSSALGKSMGLTASQIRQDLGGGDLHPGAQLIGRDPLDPLLHQLAQIAVIPGQPGNYCL